MSIKYTELSSIEVTPEEGVRVASLNSAFSKLIENDNALIPSAGFAPSIWEATWYNNPDNIKGYSKGAAVWLNTESVDQFVRNRAEDIENYAQSTSFVKSQIEEAVLNEDTALYYQLLKKFALGQFPGQSGPVYYFGELTDKVQIRISKVDDNKDLPTEDTWEDFFIRYGEGIVQQQILSVFRETCPDEFQRHMEEYHLSGFVSDASQLSGTYLLNDLTNLSDQQKFNSHYWYDSTMTGLDHVKAFVMKKFSGGRCKWFRVWDSGLLEHGGIVDPSDPSGTGDSADASLYTVNMKWTHEKGTAVTYDYPPEGLVSFYNNEKYFLNAGVQRSFENPGLGYSLRYTVQLAASDKTEQTPYSKYGGMMYDSRDVCLMNNGDFSFLLNGQTNVLVSYCVRGYSMKASRY